MILNTWIVLLVMCFVFLLLPLVKDMLPWKNLVFHSLAFFLFFAVMFLSFNLQVVTDAGIVAYEGSIYFRVVPFGLAILSAGFIARDVMGVLRNKAEGRI